VLDIPWSNLKNEPVRILIDRLYILAGPRVEGVYASKEAEKAFQSKMEKLAMAELLSQQRAQKDDDDDDNQPSFITQLVTKIVDNVQVSITNIHIRYEDSTSYPGVSGWVCV
jgi:vacuolar protein sorting-associated protein 13A/C